MKLTTKGRYAVQAVLDMFYHTNGKAVKLSDIAERQKISLNYLEQLFRRLKLSGVVKSVRGPGGGYLLTKEPSEITIEQILRGVGENLEYNSVEMVESDTPEKKAFALFTAHIDESVAQALSATLDQFAQK